MRARTLVVHCACQRALPCNMVSHASGYLPHNCTQPGRPLTAQNLALAPRACTEGGLPLWPWGVLLNHFRAVAYGVARRSSLYKRYTLPHGC